MNVKVEREQRHQQMLQRHLANSQHQHNSKPPDHVLLFMLASQQSNIMEIMAIISLNSGRCHNLVRREDRMGQDCRVSCLAALALAEVMFLFNRHQEEQAIMLSIHTASISSRSRAELVNLLDLQTLTVSIVVK